MNRQHGRVSVRDILFKALVRGVSAGLLLGIGYGGIVHAEMKPEEGAEAKNEYYVALYMLGTFPKHRPLTVDGAVSGSFSFQQTTLDGGLGGGLKAGIFPPFGHGYLGFEADVFGHTGSLTSASATTAPVGANQAAADFNVVNGMVNVLLRYPAARIQPYIGVGTGVSVGTLSSATISFGATNLVDKGSDATLAYQFLGGVKGKITERIFLFTEYKYFAANYQWDSVSSSGIHPRPSLQFRTHIVAGGIGMSF